MPDVPVINSTIELMLGLIALIAAVFGWYRKVRPWLQERADTRAAVNEVLLGRPAVPANPITGAKAQDAKPSIGQLVTEMHHELHPNDGSSMNDALRRTESLTKELIARVETIDRRLENGDRRFERIEHAIHDELQVAQDALGNAAEAAAHLLPTIHDAIKAQPPEE